MLFRSVSFSTTYYGIQVDAGNVISVTNSNYGWSNKLFRVMKVNESSLPDGSLGARLELNEYNADVYDDASITQFTPVPNSGLAAPSYFPALSAPTVIASRPTGDVPSFDVRVGIPSVGRVTYVQLFYTTNSSPSASDWILFDTYSQSNSQPLVNGTNFDFLNEILPGGTFYFAYVVGNEIAASVLSTKSSSFAWAPTGPAIQTASVSLYQWSATTPANPTGNSTYTWSTATDSGYTASDGWTIAIPANPGTSGLSLWEAQKNITASPGTTTTTVNWTTGVSVYAIAQNGTSGNSSRICFARVASNPSPVSGSIVTSGGSSYPSSAQSLSTWGFSATWGASDPDPTSTNSLYQADGVYDPVANQTTWTTPYISSLKVGYLSAISADLGSINSGSMAIGGITPSTIPIGNIWNFNGLATTANMLDVVYVTTSSTWVAVGSGGASWYRAAGSTTWNYVYTGNSADFYSVATNGTSLVAIGGNSTIIGTISAGVLSWSASTGSQRTSTTLQYRVIYVSSVNRYFTFSLLNLWYSNSSGNSWQSTTNPGNAVGCAFDGSLLWACSYSSGNVYNTTLTDNGTTVTVSWSASISTGGSNGATRDFVYLGGRFVLVGTAVRTSTSGASGTWSGTTSYPGINRVGYFSDLSNSKFYGVGISSGYSVIWQSSNGFQSSTQLITGPTQTLNAVAFSSIEGVIVGNTGTYAISQIEDSWTGSGTSINNDGAFFTGSVGGSISFDGTALTLDVPYLQNRQTITTSATVKQNYNAFSVGTITISDTADVTVPSGSVWVIV